VVPPVDGRPTLPESTWEERALSDDEFKRMGTLIRAELAKLIAALGPGSHHPNRDLDG
jgi:hypothetical protein